MRPLVKTIDLSAYRHNLQVLKSLGRIIPVVKADAYGHGLANLLVVIQDYPYLAVACIEEGLFLRELGYLGGIILLSGINYQDEISLCACYNLIPVIHNYDQFKYLKNTGKNIFAWLKIDTGMHRLGFSPENYPDLFQAAINLERQNCVRFLGIVSHFACADEMDNKLNYQQLSVIKQISIPNHWQKSWCNSAGFLRDDLRGGDWARVGLASYGISPFANKTAKDFGLKPVMQLSSQIIAINKLKAGDNAGYGQAFTADCDGFLAVIALGYGDGFSRSIESGKVKILLNKQFFPIVGRVNMDMTLIWLGNYDQAKVGDRVVIFGENAPIEHLALQADTISYTLTTMLNKRVNIKILS